MRKGYDIDGVIILKKGATYNAHQPEKTDFIITGRSFHRAFETVIALSDLMVYSPVYFNPLPPKEVNPQTAGEWKAKMIAALGIEQFFEDDEYQVNIIREKCPTVDIVHVKG